MNYSVHVLGDEFGGKVINIINKHNEDEQCTLLPGMLPIQYYSLIQRNSAGLPGFVLDDCGQVVGVGYCFPYHDAQSLRHVVEVHCYVHRFNLRIGIGTVLLETIASLLQNVGVNSLLARLPSTNLAGAAFLLKNGFTESARIPNLVQGSGKPADLVYFLRNLGETPVGRVGC